MEAAAKEVEAKKEIYVAFNILPLDPTSASEAIMTFPEVLYPSLCTYLSEYFCFYKTDLYMEKTTSQ